MVLIEVRRRPTDAATAARRAPAARARAAASGTAARGGRRRPSFFLCRVGSVLAAIFAPRQICLVALSFQALHDGVYPWRLCPRSTKTAVSSTFTACFVRRLVRCAVRLSILRLPYRKTDRFCGALQGLSRTRRLKEQPALYLWAQFEQFWGTGLIARVFTQDQICQNKPRTAHQASRALAETNES